MAKSEGPWNKRKHGADLRIRRYVWLGLLALGAVGLLELARLFPHSVESYDGAYLIVFVGWAVILSAGLIFSRQLGLGEAVRNIAIWAGIACVLVLAFTYQTELNDVWLRVRSEIAPSYAVEPSATLLAITESPGDEFLVMGTVNGEPVKFLIDTGATDIVLNPSDAKRLGIDMAALRFTHATQTANGKGLAAPYTIGQLDIGPIHLTNVAASVNETDMGSSLLGMAFLKRMKSFEIRDRRLFLHWR